jgi:hypothetical protein
MNEWMDGWKKEGRKKRKEEKEEMNEGTMEEKWTKRRKDGKMECRKDGWTELRMKGRMKGRKEGRKEGMKEGRQER